MDRCLPMGCAIFCSFFETFSSFLDWVVCDLSGLQSLIHYLDDFLVVGPLGTLQHVFKIFRVPLAPEKTEGPGKFLGIIIDKRRMECRLPVDKLEDLRGMVTHESSC